METNRLAMCHKIDILKAQIYQFKFYNLKYFSKKTFKRGIKRFIERVAKVEKTQILKDSYFVS